MHVHKGVYMCPVRVVFHIVLVFLSGTSEGFLSWYVFITCWILMFQNIRYVCLKFCEKIKKAVIETDLLIYIVLSDASLS
jgi:hypothetical protein